MPQHIVHPIPPFYDGQSRILVLGSFPSVKTRESGFFYGHPQNRFWKLMAALSSIINVVPSDLSEIFRTADIRAVFTNGKKSHEVYARYCLPDTGRPDICLPSTSPANAAWSMERLTESWSVIKEYL